MRLGLDIHTAVVPSLLSPCTRLTCEQRIQDLLVLCVGLGFGAESGILTLQCEVVRRALQDPHVFMSSQPRECYSSSMRESLHTPALSDCVKCF